MNNKQNPHTHHQDQYFFKDEIDDESQQEQYLKDNDIKNIIKLEQKFIYIKTLIEIKPMTSQAFKHHDKRIVKIITKLNQYYTECINQIQENIETIIKYFQSKMRNINSYYQTMVNQKKKTVQKIVQKLQHTSARRQSINIELGHVSDLMAQPQLQQDDLMMSRTSMSDIKKEVSSSNNSKDVMNKNLMIMLKNQQINRFVEKSKRKAEFAKLTIAKSIEDQQKALEKRIQENKKKRYEKSLSKQSFVETPTPDPQEIFSFDNVKINIDLPVKAIKQPKTTPSIMKLMSDSSSSSSDDSEISFENIILEKNGELQKNTKK